MMFGFSALADDAKGVILHDRGATNAAQETLLHATVELEDGYLGRGDLYVDRDLAKSDPRDEDTALF
jgi:hypothetical protein